MTGAESPERTVDTFSQKEIEVHHKALHTALEEYLDRDLPGSITYIQYPAEDVDHGNVKVCLAEVVEEDV